MRNHFTVTASRNKISCDGTNVNCQLYGRGKDSTESKDCKRNEEKVKLQRAQGECLGTGSRRRTWLTAKSLGEL